MLIFVKNTVVLA